jgi:hypothetical protein
MSKELIQQKITADPSKFSLREEALDLELEGRDKGYRNIYFDRKTGERFYKIFSYEAQVQKLLTLILKGVINISDIVKVGNNYYSHVQNFDNIKPGTENVLSEIEADLFIIKMVFEDNDHGYYYNSVQKGAVVEHQNLRVSKKDNKFNIFDFGATKLDNLKFSRENFSDLEKMFKEEIKRQIGIEHPEYLGFTLPDKVLEILRKKVATLIGLCGDNEFGNFKEIIKKSGIELTEEEQRTLFYNIRLRLQALNKVLSELEPSN